jgi:hypothetical protein
MEGRDCVFRGVIFDLSRRSKAWWYFALFADGGECLMSFIYLGDDILGEGITRRGGLVRHVDIVARGGWNSHRGLDIDKGPTYALVEGITS